MTQVGNGIDAVSGGWSFAGATVEAFDTHALSSIPAYLEGHELIADLADQLVPPGGRCYDLGCATGALTVKLAARLAARGAELVGVDSEPGMIVRANERAAGIGNVRFVTSTVEELRFEPAALVVAYYTLQFVALRHRRAVVAAVRRALEPGGTLILFEKTLAPTAAAQTIAEAAYDDWKRRQGYSDEEIAAKARSLRGVLRPQSGAANEEMLREAGFADVTPVFRWLNWEGLVARAG
jgi:tRNA (cmo5U34)-methyltransferase